ncbi:hypothetical protein BAU15_01640 [Enterococcus sp. JM4C]|uniref:hypothetical protein n=1 Tax=Candidatus Enterococcus huntleyi TaxID=1857217 RepID=UPI00137B16D6|nr:hypothetical protein [Enterococcus sp. JM4C]KAF1299375.1 hypothetical protein BAU15_01640 [Enterococcus sp. JM4C]
MLINVPLNIHDQLINDTSFKEKFKTKVIDKVKSNYKNFEKSTGKSDGAFNIVKYISVDDIEEILLGSIFNNTNIPFIDNYRKTVTFAEVDFYERVSEYKKTICTPCKDEFYLKKYYEAYNNEFLGKILANSYKNDPGKKISEEILTEKGFKNLQAKVKKHLEKFNKDVGEIFGFYNEYISNGGLRAQILHSTNITVCPYCNRQYTTPFYIEGEEKIQADLEHFYPKSKYPLFALSIMNFIPSCLFCNRNLKANKIFDNLYFIKDTMNHTKVFTDGFNDYNQLMGFSNSKISIDIDSLGGDDILKKIDLYYYKKTYYLDEIYASHSELISDLKKKKSIYNKDYMKEFSKNMKTDLHDMDLDNFIFGYNGSEEELLNRPLSKLVQDLILNT